MSGQVARRWVRVLAVAVALLATTAGPAAADNTTDQITGAGQTASAVTVSWAQGLVGADNTTVVAPRDPNSSLSFMYPDFKDLKVTVGQTQNLVHQAVQVTWQNFNTPGGANPNFLQIMECYGDSNNGPSPENCEYGTRGLFGNGNVPNPFIGSRTGNFCTAGAVPDKGNPAAPIGGEAPNAGCDTQEPSDPSHNPDPSHLPPNPDNNSTYFVPFIPADSTKKLYDTAETGLLTDFFDRFNTNEVQDAATGGDGTGQDFFPVLTATEAPGLGCGEVEANGSTRNCWLVVVPRGQYKPNGWHLVPSGNNGPALQTDSPLGASNWAQRIQVHLGFNPIPNRCAIGSASERETVGTQLVGNAVFSWQLALNAAANCKTIYGFAAVPEASNTKQLVTGGTGSAGLAFTTVPIGSEAGRIGAGGPGPNLPPLVYAPISLSATTFAFNVNLSSTHGFRRDPIKLTPLLVAKALTQSYKEDLPDFDSNHPGPTWAKNNPNSILSDPEFQALNPGVQDNTGSGAPKAPLLTSDHSGINQQVWQWILADPAAKAWLSGTSNDPMVVNPNYVAIHIGDAALDSYPRQDPTKFDAGVQGGKEAIRDTLTMLPYVENLSDAAAHVRAANNPLGAGWDPTAIAPDGTTGWWGKGGIEPASNTFMWAVTDSANLANNGLVPAVLCDASGGNCVGPNTGSVSATLTGLKPDSAGLLHVDPAHPASGSYPLVNLIYAAVSLSQPADARNDYAALIEYAAGQGQTPGVDPGQLPHGYLPLPDSLRAQASAAAAIVRSGVLPTSDTGPPTDAGTQQGTTPDTSTGANTGGATDTGAGAAPTTGASPTTAAGNPGRATGKQPPKLAARRTPIDQVSAMRWILLVIVIVGLVGGVSAALMRSTNVFPKLLARIRLRR